MESIAFDTDQLVSFFGVLVRLSVVFSVMPWIGDRTVPSPVKILLALSTSICVFPVLVKFGHIVPRDSRVWSNHLGSLTLLVGSEALFGFAFGFLSRFAFEALGMGANLVGNFMGFAAASTFDPHQESQTEVVAHFQTTLGMLLFLSVDGQHMLLQGILSSYRVVGLGAAGISRQFSFGLVHIIGEMIKIALQMAAPVAISIFAMNLIFGLFSKAVPQVNVFALSYTVSALLGFCVLILGMGGFGEISLSVFEQLSDWLAFGTRALIGRGT